jgi:hypothetical protein
MARPYRDPDWPDEPVFKTPLTIRRLIDLVGWNQFDTPLEVHVSGNRYYESTNGETQRPKEIHYGIFERDGKGKRRLVLCVELREHRLVKKSRNQR